MSRIDALNRISSNPDKRFRRLVFTITELETCLKTAGRADASESIRAAARELGNLVPEIFLDDMRTALEAVLLGQRDLPGEIIGQVMDGLASIDEILRTSLAGPESDVGASSATIGLERA